jgi:hypothetical protein
VLRTLVNKYGYSRDEFFISSKQGFTSYDQAEDVPIEVEVMEVIAESGGKLTEKDFFWGLDVTDPLQHQEAILTKL